MIVHIEPAVGIPGLYNVYFSDRPPLFDLTTNQVTGLVNRHGTPSSKGRAEG